MLVEPGELMRQTYDENTRWLVKCDRREYEISGKQLNIIKEASDRNMRGIVWFKKFAVSIPHISSIYMVGKDHPKDRQLSSRASPEKISKEEFKRREVALEKLRKDHGFLK